MGVSSSLQACLCQFVSSPTRLFLRYVREAHLFSYLFPGNVDALVRLLLELRAVLAEECQSRRGLPGAPCPERTVYGTADGAP